MSILSLDTIKTVSFSLILFIYPIHMLSLTGLSYFETLHRVTTLQTFDSSLFGSTNNDALAILSLSFLFLALTLNSRMYRVLSAVAFSFFLFVFLLQLAESMIHLAAAAALPLLVLLLTIEFTSRKHQRARITGKDSHIINGRIDVRRVIVSFLAIVVIIESLALIRWAIYPATPSEIYSESTWIFARLESSLFHSLALLSPSIVLLASFWYFYKPHIGIFKQFINSISCSLRKSSKRVIDRAYPHQGGDFQGTEYLDKNEESTPAGKGSQLSLLQKNVHISNKVLVMSALVIASLIAVYPHIPAINLQQSGVSVDEKYYSSWLLQLREESTNISELLVNAFKVNFGERPLSLLLVVFLANVTNLPDATVVRFLPVALAPALVASNYYLVLHNLRSEDRARDRRMAAWAALFTALSAQVVVGMYAGLLANWLALIAGSFALHFAMTCWNSNNILKTLRNGCYLAAVFLLIMLLHVYTWGYFIAAIAVFATISLITSRKTTFRPAAKILVIAIVAAGSVGLEYSKSFVYAGPVGLDRDIQMVGSDLDLQNFNGRFDNLDRTLGSYMGGYLSTPVVWILVIVWLVRSNYSSFNRILLATLAIISIPAIFGSVEFQARVIFNAPLHLMAFLGLFPVAPQRSSDKNWLGRLAVIAVLLSLAIYCLRAMANLNLVLPVDYELEKPFLLK
jgi:hypothetical protein